MVEQLYTVYADELQKYCVSMCRNMTDAEDLLQETFMRALSNLDVLEDLGEKQRRAWLYKVARNIYFDRLRKASTEKKYTAFAEEEYEGGFDTIETGMIISQLPSDLSDVFIKRYFKGYTSKMLAEEYGITASGIRSMLYRARQILKENMEK